MKDKILSLIRSKGPVIPKDISKNFKLDTFFSGAYLSELVETKKLNLTFIRVGGSPLYYLPDQKEQLQSFSKYLNEKDKTAFELLRKEKVLRDNELQPLFRVSMRNMKDFAIQLTVNLPTGQEIFWKWYLLSKEDAEKIIKEKMVQHDIKQMPLQQHPNKPAQLSSHPSPPPTDSHQDEASLLVSPKNIPDPQSIEKIKLLEKEIMDLKAASNKEKTESIKKEHISVSQMTLSVKELQKKTESPPLPSEPLLSEQIVLSNDHFLNTLKSYFDDKQISLEQFTINRKSKDIDLVIKMPTPFGTLDYFCAARDKKRCNEGDLSAAYVKSQVRKLPLLFLTTGMLTKKAQQMLENEFKGHVITKQLENGSKNI